VEVALVFAGRVCLAHFAVMGQIINVEVRQVDDENVREFAMDRGLTGQGLEVYSGPDDATSNKSSDRLARRLFEIDGVSSVFLYGNVLSVTKSEGASWDELVPKVEEIVRNLFIAYDVNRV
jgi:hypothetical protein